MLTIQEQRRNEIIMQELAKHGARVAKMTREEARADLIATGIYTADGNLHRDYGGAVKAKESVG